jgi:hypothetical protein
MYWKTLYFMECVASCVASQSRRGSRQTDMLLLLVGSTGLLLLPLYVHVAHLHNATISSILISNPHH